MNPSKVLWICLVLVFELWRAEVLAESSTQIHALSDDSKTGKDLKTEASGRIFEGIPATVYGAPGGGYYPSTGWSGSNYNTGLGYNGYSGYSGYTSPGYSGYSGSNGYNGYSGLTGIGYNSLGGGYNRGYPYSTFNSAGYGGYLGNGGYGGFGGNGGLVSYSGYNNPYYNTQNNLGYGYYKGGIGSGYYNKGYGLSGYGGITPGYVTGYRGYTK